MTTELALRGTTTPAAAIAQSLNDHVAALHAAHEIAGLIHKTVQAFDGGTDTKGKQRPGRAEATVAIYHGQLIGLDPIQSLQNIIVVHGTPTMYARTMRALLVRDGHQVETVESTERRATVRAKHRNAAQWEEVTWTIERADRAGYTSNPKYKTNPTDMLYARALADACRRAAPDVLLGMSYSSEELESEPEQEPTPLRVQSERVAPTAADILAEPAAQTPSAPIDTSNTPADPPPNGNGKQPPAKRRTRATPGKITDEQITEAARMLDALGRTTTDEKREFLREFLGRNDIQEARELTDTEALEVLYKLRALHVKAADPDEVDLVLDETQHSGNGQEGAK